LNFSKSRPTIGSLVDHLKVGAPMLLLVAHAVFEIESRAVALKIMPTTIFNILCIQKS
jgi:hypothetical protein